MAVFAHHGTLVGGAVTTVPITSADGTIQVINRSGVADIFFTVNGTTPVGAADDTYVAVAVAGASYIVNGLQGVVTVSLISSGVPTFSVIGGQVG